MKGECSCGTNPICLNQIVTMAFGSLLGVGFIAFLSEYNDIDLLLHLEQRQYWFMQLAMCLWLNQKAML